MNDEQLLDLLDLTDKILILRGGATSGNWGHTSTGRQGKHGGSDRGGGHGKVGVKGKPTREKLVKASGQKRKGRKEPKQRAEAKEPKQRAAAKETILKDRKGLEDFSRDELLTLRARIDQLLGGSDEANNKLVDEKPGIEHGHTVTVLGTDPTKKYEMRYEVRELDDLIVSNTDSGAINPDFPKDLQPRDRSRVASQRQIDNIASDLQPEALLGEFKAIDRGSPIIGDDNAVESGNGRSMALRRARDKHPDQYANYQSELRKDAKNKGIDPKNLDNFKDPVLVRVRKSDVDRVEFVKEANTASILGTSDTERARSDASRVSSEHLQNLEMRGDIDGTIRAPSNRAFVRSFVANTPEVERAAMIDKNGKLNATGEKRIKAAMFNRVYDSPDISDRIFESTDNDIKNVTNGIMNSLGPMTKAEELVRTGQRGKGLSIAPDIAKTVQVYASLKERKMSVSDFLAQGALFGRELNPSQEKILVEIDKRRRSGKQLSEFFQGWSDLVDREPHPGQGSLFGGGGGGGRSKDQLVNQWIESANRGPQISLFADIIKGGPTSGNWGHISSSRRGKHGGSDPGGGLGAVGVAPGASRKEIVAASGKERAARTEGVVKVSPKAVGEARLNVAREKRERDKSLKAVRAAEKDFLRKQDTWRKSSDNLTKTLKKTNKMDAEIKDLRDKHWDLMDKTDYSDEKAVKRVRALGDRVTVLEEKRDKIDLGGIFKKHEVLSKAMNEAEETIKNTGTPEFIMAGYQSRTQKESEVLFQHNLNEAKRVRAQMKVGEIANKRKIDSLQKQRIKTKTEIDSIFAELNDKKYPADDPRHRELLDKANVLGSKRNKLTKQYLALEDQGMTGFRDLVAVDNPTKIVAAPGSQRDPQKVGKDRWKKGREGFENLVSDDVLPKGSPVRFKNTSESRSFQTSILGLSEVHMAEFAGQRTMVHELGHTAEAYNPRLLKRSLEWRDGRTKGEKWQELSEVTGNDSYDNSEVTKPDKFISPYIGKRYTDASEVFSMGVEAMYQDPAQMAEKDPDFFDFTYAQMRTP